MFAKVAVPVPLGRAFSYEIPADLEARVVPGARVLCPFGSRRIAGVVLEIEAELPNLEPGKIKRIEAVVDREPALPRELLDFLVAVARYYLAPIGEVVRLALPAVERAAQHDLKAAGLLGGIKLSAVGRLVKVAALEPSRGVEVKGNKAQAIMEILKEGPMAVSVLEKREKGARAVIKRLVGVGVVKIEDREEVTPDPFEAAPRLREAPKVLTPEQDLAVRAICRAMDEKEGAQFLLDGVTGSGKTEVYVRAVEHCLSLGKGALVLVPEIALTPQLVGRFQARLGESIGVIHSGLSEPKRFLVWQALRAGKLKVVVGARSALFAPVENLGLLCVDEEHDSSFKQEEGVRYHARDMALLRAHKAKAVSVLGSATPSLASLSLVESGRMRRLALPRRAIEASRLPSVEVVDLRRVGPGPTGDRWLSLPLYRAIAEGLERGEQTILFLNRRGFAPSLICDACGTVSGCPNCSVALTAHRTPRLELRCHYCDFVTPFPNVCQKCKSPALSEEGAGTERVVAVLEEAFPKARVARLDRDVASGIKSERVLARVRGGEVDILVGTQMVTKGHDLPKVTLVGVLNADAALSMPDFSASERCFQLLVQVAGRAGRGEAKGHVIIQTRTPEHPAIRCAAMHDVKRFNEIVLAERKELGYPPYSRMAVVRFDSLDEASALEEANRLMQIALAHAQGSVRVLGPAPAPLLKLRNRYRYRFMLRAEDRNDLRRPLLAVARAAPDRRVRMSIDIDPVNLLA